MPFFRGSTHSHFWVLHLGLIFPAPIQGEKKRPEFSIRTQGEVLRPLSAHSAETSLNSSERLPSIAPPGHHAILATALPPRINTPLLPVHQHPISGVGLMRHAIPLPGAVAVQKMQQIQIKARHFDVVGVV